MEKRSFPSQEIPVKKGAEYAVKEVTDPTRIVTTAVRVKNGSMPVVSVKTARDIPKGKIFNCVDALRDVCVEAPVQIGDVILENSAGTGVDIVATGNVKQDHTVISRGYIWQTVCL